MSWQVYILGCADGTLYTGVSNNLEKRLRQHNGELVGGAKYTQARRPVELLWSESAEDRSTAQRREVEIKGLTRSAKIALVKNQTSRDTI